MSAPGIEEFDDSLSADDVIADLEAQLGIAAGQISRLRLMLQKRTEQMQFLRAQLARQQETTGA